MWPLWQLPGLPQWHPVATDNVQTSGGGRVSRAFHLPQQGVGQISPVAMASQLPPEQSLTNEEGRLIANSGGKIFKSAHVTLKDGKRETKNRRDECQGSRFKRNNIDNYLK